MQPVQFYQDTLSMYTLIILLFAHHLLICPPILLFAHPSSYLPTIFLFAHPSSYLPTHPLICPPILLFACCSMCEISGKHNVRDSLCFNVFTCMCTKYNGGRLLRYQRSLQTLTREPSCSDPSAARALLRT